MADGPAYPSHGGEQVTCPGCSKEFKNRLALGVHISKSHRERQAELLIASKTLKGEHDECWLWDGRHHEKGYAELKLHDGQIRRVSRELLGLAKGDPRVARHTCDNPPCVNPDHLLVGTDADNTQDMTERGRDRGRFEKGNYPARWLKRAHA